MTKPQTLKQLEMTSLLQCGTDYSYGQVHWIDVYISTLCAIQMLVWEAL